MGFGAAVLQLLVAKLAQIMSRPSATSRWACSCCSGGGCCARPRRRPRQAWQPLPDVFVSNRGIVFPVPFEDPAHFWMLGAFVLGCLATWRVSRGCGSARRSPDSNFPSGMARAGLILGLAARRLSRSRRAAAARCSGVARLQLYRRHRRSRRNSAALLLGLVIYNAISIAEIVRAGILAVSWGQSEQPRPRA